MKMCFALGLLLSLAWAVHLHGEDSRPVDLVRAKKAEVVLRVRLISPGEGSKYLWDRVEVLKVLKNKSGYAFGKQLAVAHYSWKRGIPEGTCTIYLERYNPGRKDQWKLLGGSADEGVSHASPERD